MAPLRERFILGVPLAVLAVTIVAVPVMVFGDDGLARHRRLRAQLEAQRQENVRLARQLIQLRAEFSAVTPDPRARERAGREELGWVRPDELVVEVPASALPSRLAR